MRIWIVNHHADPPDGLATRSFDIARRFVEKGNPTTIFVCAFSHYHLRPVRKLGFRLLRSEDIEGVRMVWIAAPSYRGNDWRRVLNMVTFSVLALLSGALRRERPDIVVGVSVHPLAALSGWLLSRLKGARFFFEVTDLWPQTLIDFGRLRADGRAARAMRSLERFLFRHAERIVMLWRHTDEYVASQGVSPAKILWVPHGVELKRYDDLVPYRGAPARPSILFGRSSYDPVRDAQAGISVPPGDPEALADAIFELVALTPEERIEMGERGRRYLLEHHNIPVLSDRLLNVFEKTEA